MKTGEKDQNGRGRYNKSQHNSLLRGLAYAAIVVSSTAGISANVQAGTVLKLRAGQYNMNQLAINPYVTTLMSVKNEKPLHYILQFKRPLTVEEKSQITARGIQFLRYIPEDAYIVRAKNSTLANLQQANSIVQGYTYYQAAFKLSPQLEKYAAQDASRPALVNVYTLDSQNKVETKLKALGAKVVQSGPGVVTVKVTGSQVGNLAKIDSVEWVEKAPKIGLLDFAPDGTTLPPSTEGHLSQLTGYETGTKVMNFDAAWNAGLKGQGQLVTVGDTGLDTGNLATLSPDFSSVLYNAIIFGIGSSTWGDPMGHGTHVSGSIVGQGVLSNGLVHGGAPGAQLLMESLWSQQYKTLTTPDNLATLFQDAYNDGSRVHSDSWGSVNVPSGVYDAQAATFDQFIWQHPSMVILVAAGNDGVDANGNGRVDADSVKSPGTAKNIISVGASKNYDPNEGLQMQVGDACFVNPKTGKCFVDPKTGQVIHQWPVGPLASSYFSDNPDGLAPFSSRGPTADGRIKPDIVAPGTNILSDCSQYPGASTLWGRFNQNYCWSGGTSMATPLTAAAVVLIRQYLQQSGAPSPSAALVKAILLHTAYDMYPGEFGAIGAKNGQEILTPAPNGDEGFGRVDLANVINENIEFVDEKTGVGTGQVMRYSAPATTRKVTLVYTDYPGSPTAATALVNHLGLEVVVGNQVFRTHDKVDNAKQIVIPESVVASAHGDDEIVVTGTNVPMGNSYGKQPFALVFSN